MGECVPDHPSIAVEAFRRFVEEFDEEWEAIVEAWRESQS